MYIHIHICIHCMYIYTHIYLICIFIQWYTSPSWGLLVQTMILNMFPQQQFCISLSCSSKPSNLMSHMSLLSIWLLCWPNYRSSPFSHRRKLLKRCSGCFFSPGHGFFWGERLQPNCNMKSQQRCLDFLFPIGHTFGSMRRQGAKTLKTFTRDI